MEEMNIPVNEIEMNILMAALATRVAQIDLWIDTQLAMPKYDGLSVNEARAKRDDYHKMWKKLQKIDDENMMKVREAK